LEWTGVFEEKEEEEEKEYLSAVLGGLCHSLTSSPRMTLRRQKNTCSKSLRAGIREPGRERKR